MTSLINFIVNRRFWIVIVFTALLLVAGLGALSVDANYDMGRYLDSEMPSVKGFEKTTDEFGIPTTVRVMVEDVSMAEAVDIKDRIKNASYVQSIYWLDDVQDIAIPIEMMEKSIVNQFYKENSAIYTIYFDYSEYSTETKVAIEEIQEIIGSKGYIFGPASSSQEVVRATESSVGKLIILFLPIITIILIFATNSWLEPIIFLVVLGFAVAFNAGTNIIFKDVSFVTQSMASAIQLAISMDYSIFLLHRFAEEKRKGLNPDEAMKEAVKRSFGTITASAITTIAGFSSLLLMKFRFGMDMGLVFGKGIIFSYITAMILLPAITLMLTKLIDKTTHRSFLPSFKLLGKLVFKLRYLSILIILIVVVPAFLGQQKSDFIYGGSGIAEEEGTQTNISKNKIEDRFGAFNPMIVLVPRGDRAKESNLSTDLEKYKYVASVQTIATLTDPVLPEEILPANVVDQFVSENTVRLIIGLNTEEESAETFEALEWIDAKVKQYYGDNYWASGLSYTLNDIKNIAPRDNFIVTALAVLAVAIVIAINFRNLVLPIVLVFTIQSAVFINMSIPYFVDNTIIFVGMLIVSSLMLGATIDYAILMTSRYIERREKSDRKEALILSIQDAGGSIFTSASVLTVAGFAIQYSSEVKTVSEMGELIGRGAILSGLVVLIVLPALLYVFDKMFIKGGINVKTQA